LKLGLGELLSSRQLYEKAAKPSKPTRLRYLMKKLFKSMYWLTLTRKLDWVFKLYFGNNLMQVDRK